MEGKDKRPISDSTSHRPDASPAKRSRGDTINEQGGARAEPGSSTTSMRESRSSPLLDVLPSPGVQRDAKLYNMCHTKRGLAIIIDHVKFDRRMHGKGAESKPQDRDGTEHDRQKLRETFLTLGFEVECLIDKTYNEIKLKLKQVSCVDHSEHDCLAVAVLTHGDEGDMLYARDQRYAVKDLWQLFTASECPSLAGKPKLFFIQACRGGSMDVATYVRSVSGNSTDAPHNNPPGSFQVPTYADFLISYATFDGMVAMINRESGSWYVNTLCNELRKYGEPTDSDEKIDLVSMLTDVNQVVAQNFSSPNWQDSPTSELVQVPCFISSLTRRVYF